MIQTLEIVENRRNSYATPSTEDSFIVNLLRNGIETILATQPAPLNGRALDIGCGSQPFRDRRLKPDIPMQSVLLPGKSCC
jgi:hypothetical protein